ncbi:hypothetical protein MMC12_008643 [Toensbergia leucococca]|nr:hypothetical protein [Toensbergia leucococca]
MVFKISPGMAIAIGVGGAVLLFGALSMVIIVHARARHKRLLALTNAAGERRLSGYPGGHLSIVDTDLAPIPPSRRVLRRSIHHPYSNQKVWSTLSSRESLPRRPVMLALPKGMPPDMVDQNTTAPKPSWPLPRRLLRSKAIPLATIKGLPLSPITERSTNKTDPSPTIANITDLSPVNSPRESTRATTDHQITDSSRNISTDNLPDIDSKPLPLFLGRQRSFSSGPITKASTNRKNKPAVSFAEPEEAKSQTLQRPHLPRSTSLCSQYSGLAPNEPVPPLPFEAVPPKRIQKLNNLTQSSPIRVSGTSFMTDSSSILNEGGSRSLSQAETDFTSVNLLSPSTSAGLGIYHSSSISWDPSNPGSTTIPHGRSAKRESGPHIKLQGLVHASIEQYSLPRSGSSGLSMSLLDNFGPSPSESNASYLDRLSRELVLSRSKPSLASKSAERRQSTPRQRLRDDLLPSSQQSQNSVVNNPQSAQSQRASASILQAVSGNQGSPMHDQLQSRPSSIATSNPFHWDSKTSVRPSTSPVRRSGSKGHKRQNCVRISSITPTNSPSVFPPTAEEHEELPQKIAIPGLFLAQPQNTQAIYHPPSRPNFDPQMQKPFRTTKSTTYSPTLSMVNFYETNGSSDSIMYTPTKQSTQRCPSGANPNRHRTVFSDSANADWPLPPEHSTGSASASTSFLGESVTLPHFSQVADTSITPRPPSFLFPVPPPAKHPLRHRPSKSPIRGPRALPSRHPSPIRRSPTRGVGKPSSSTSNRDLRKDIMTLRRMNSEVSNVDAGEHRRYLGMGDEKSVTEDKGEGGDEAFDFGFEATQGRRKQGMEEGDEDPTKDRAFISSRWDMTPGLYDRDGFLRD